MTIKENIKLILKTYSNPNGNINEALFGSIAQSIMLENFPLPEPTPKEEYFAKESDELTEEQRKNIEKMADSIIENVRRDDKILKNIEAIKKKWQKRLKPIESNAITATAQQIEIYKRQQEIGYQKAVKEILSDLQGEK